MPTSKETASRSTSNPKNIICSNMSGGGGDNHEDQNQFNISIILFGNLIVAISASAIVTSQYVERGVSEQEKVNNLIQGANDVSYIANDYMMYRSSQELALWQSSFSGFSNEAANLQGHTVTQTALLEIYKQTFLNSGRVQQHCVRSGKFPA